MLSVVATKYLHLSSLVIWSVTYFWGGILLTCDQIWLGLKVSNSFWNNSYFIVLQPDAGWSTRYEYLVMRSTFHILMASETMLCDLRSWALIFVSVISSDKQLLRFILLMAEMICHLICWVGLNSWVVVISSWAASYITKYTLVLLTVAQPSNSK